MSKVSFGNSEILENGNAKLSRKPKSGIILALCLTIGFGSLYGLHLDNIQNNLPDEDPSPKFKIEELGKVSINDDFFTDNNESTAPSIKGEPINVSLEEINSMNIIINDDNCMAAFINEVCEELDRDGIKYTFTSDCENIDVDETVVITLDQQYMAGPGTVVFAPLENERLGNSDALALAAQTAFYEKGFLMDGVVCGQLGFRENEDGSISERVPTATEEAIGKERFSSFITISFGTNNTHAGLTAAAIEATLTRYYSYINNGYGQEDLIYCVQPGESYDDIAGKLGTTSNMLDLYNDTTDESMLLTGETIINPSVGEKTEFDNHTVTNLYIDMPLWSK